MSKKLTKAEAAEFLNVSLRAIERYAAAAKLTTHYEEQTGADGRPRSVALFDKAELERLKREMTGPRPLPAKAAPSAALATPEALAALVEAITAQVMQKLLPPASEQAHTAPAVPLADKLTLSVREAAALSGLSVGYLLTAIHEEKLKAAKRGRGWNVKRSDLDAFVRKL